MEEKKTSHCLILNEKSHLTITQVTDVDAFDEKKIVIFTDDDTLEIEGDELHIQKLDVNSGELIIDGNIYSLVYTGKSYGKSSSGFFKKLLK